MIRRVLNLINEIIGNLYSKGSFIQNFAIVFSGKSAVFLIGFLLTPIIARIYSPEAYGTYALYNAIVLNLSIVISLKLPTSFVTVQDDRDFKTLSQATVGIILIGTLIVSLIFAFFDKFLFDKFENQNLTGLWYIIGIGVFLKNMTDFMGNWNVREKAFSKSTKVAISESIGTKGGSLIVGTATQGILTGLILGEFIGKALHLVVQTVLFIKGRFQYLSPEFSIRKIIQILRKYKDYPLLVMPSAWVGQLSNTLIIFYLSAIYLPHYVGAFSMANGLLMIPVMLIANASQPLLTHKVVENTVQGKPIIEIVNKFIYTIIVLLFVPIFIAILISEPLINLFLGENWEVSAKLISWLSPLILLHMIYTPLNGVLIGLKKNKQLFISSLIRVSILSLTLITLPILSTDFYSGIRWFILGSATSLIVSIFYIIKSIGIPFSWRLGIFSIIYIVGCIICYGFVGFF